VAVWREALEVRCVGDGDARRIPRVRARGDV
jgi:hypothetical protein